MATSTDSLQTIHTIHKEALLAHSLRSKDKSTLLGGQSPREVVHNNQYIPLMTVSTEVEEKEVQENSQSFEHVILTALSEDRDEPKPIIVVGPAGCGKTIALKKLMTDWATDEHLQHFSFVFHFTFRELNALRGALSLETLLLQHYSHLSKESLSLVLQKPESLMFMFDGLDQYQHSLDSPTPSSLCSDPRHPASASVLVASLVRGTLLKGAAIMLATRPTSSLESVIGHRVELLGFLKPQRKAYCDSFFSDLSAGSQAFQNIERTMGFYDFCTSPKFYWIICSIYKSLLEAGERLPETLTQVFVSVTVHLIQALSLDKAQARDLVCALGRMASHCYVAQHASCSKEEMTSFGLHPFLTSLTPLSSFVRIDGDLESDDCVISFHTQMMQEFILAASFYLDQSKVGSVDEMLQKHDGHVKFLDLYLSGLSEPTQREPLESQLGDFNTDRITGFSHWFKRTSQEVLKGLHKEKHLHCFHLLHQSQNERLVKEITTSARGISLGGLSVQDCVVLNYIVTCKGEIDQLNLYNSRELTEEKASLLVPAMRLSHKIILSQNTLSVGSLSHLASALNKGRTIELDLSYNPLGDAGFKVLSSGLKDSSLHTLHAPACGLTEACCEDLAAVLTSVTSQLRVFDLMGNELRDQGLRQLSQALGSPHCRLEELQLQMCELTADSMEALSTALCSGQSALRLLNLTKNTIGDRGMDQLAKALLHPRCQLQGLILTDSGLTGDCCAGVAEALQSEDCSLTELSLSVNELGQEGALLLCEALSKPGCSLETLSLEGCDVTPTVVQKLSSVLRSGTSRLRSLNVAANVIGVDGAKHLWEALGDQRCRLEHLDVEMIHLTDECLGDLCAGVRASGSLKSLSLKYNELTDASVPTLVKLVQDSHTMKELNLQYNDFSEDVFELMDQCAKIRY